MQEPNFPKHLTTTIYHFGISEDDEIIGFAYRSTNDFASEKLEYGLAVKPECFQDFDGNLIENIKPIMLEQRLIQSGKPLSERIHIGGQCVLMYLTRENCISQKLFDFDDFEVDYERALSEIDN